MPETKLDPVNARRQIRETPSVITAADHLGVHPSTVSRFIQREGIDLQMIRMANDHGYRRICNTLSDIGLSRSHIARRLAVSTSYITQILTQPESTHV